ncbi:UDP-N-acetylmuramoyl-L-alanyl-D-glutamate--2,6-diaminopimelate ligase MurE homolog, chloroplastic [Lotus japonicus]|uniref:UDP-N-acetylmuramoyl-L-alanyl-D-glutamate--2, 6-diaminopimelate ligase MurE homolog, chloroplastic n=1 Tax=Lotus japonicus TaxID=34305 RepID=UPI00258F260B|nr:UDP-N-acetylmuramoyl-L-alanyl-D-glutamate--2,6-diaminopimelate ligase MurE homolog, chloroplastic [Lotus japonicus]
MALPFLTLPSFFHTSNSITATFAPPSTRFRSHSYRLRPPGATGADGIFYPNPSDDDPPEAPEDSAHGFSKFQQIHIQADRARQIQEEDFKKNQSTFLAAIADVEDAPDIPSTLDSGADDLFGEIDKAIALKRKEFVKQGLLQPNPAKPLIPDVADELQPDELADVEEIDQLRDLAAAATSDEPPGDFVGEGDDSSLKADSPFELDFESYGKSKARIVEPKFRMSLAELLDESKVVPVSVYGNLEVEITGIQHDSRLVTSGNLFVCCVKNDGHVLLSEADKRGAVAVVASKEIDIEDTLGCKALVIVEDTNAVLAALAASFYRYPSKNMAVIGIAGTYGKTTTTYLIKSMYEAMGLRTGMFNSIACYVHGDNQLDLEAVDETLDAVLVQNLMAKMLHNGTEAVVAEASSHGLAEGKYDEVDFDIAVFTNMAEEADRDENAKLFSRMVDPDRHRKVVNIDDPNAPSFVSLGSPDVPVVTFALENKDADVHPLKFELSLFETQVLVNTPTGILEISSGLLGRHNVYNILAAVAVGIAVGAPLEDIVRGIEEVDAVPGRCELIDEEQAYGVIVDYARTPDALSRLLDSVRELGPRRIITVIGCCGEDDRGKRPLMTKIATDKSEVTMLTSDNSKSEDPLDILDDMLAGVGWTMQEYLKYGENDYYPPLPNGHRLFLHDIRRVAVRAAVAMGEEGDVVVIAGKGHETYEIAGEKRDFFDDREECREALQYVDELHQAGIDTSEFPWRLPESH